MMESTLDDVLVLMHEWYRNGLKKLHKHVCLSTGYPGSIVVLDNTAMAGYETLSTYRKMVMLVLTSPHFQESVLTSLAILSSFNKSSYPFLSYTAACRLTVN